MIQRLLRGRLFYLFLGGLVLFLYLTTPFPRSRATLHPASPVETRAGDATDWWPQELDAAAVQRLMREHPRDVLLFCGLVSFLVALGLVGIGATVWGFGTGRSRVLWQFTAPPLPRWTLGEFWRIAFLTLAVGALMPLVHLTLRSPPFSLAVDLHRWVMLSMLFLDAFVIIAIFAFAEGKPVPAWRAGGFSLHDVSDTLRRAFRSYVAVFPWLFLILAAVVHVTCTLGWQPPIEPLQELIFQERRGDVLGLTLLLACVIGPVAEECLFRGVIYAGLRQRLPRAWAILLSGAAFALLHMNLIGSLSILLLGCFLAYLYERTGSLVGPIAVHVVHNILLMSLALGFRSLMALGARG